MPPKDWLRKKSVRAGKVLKKSRSSIQKKICLTRIFKQQSKRMQLVDFKRQRQCINKQRDLTRLIHPTAKSGQNQLARARSHCSASTVQAKLSALDPIVAASFDPDGIPTVDHVGRTSLHIAMGSLHKSTLEFTIEVFKERNMLACRDNANFTPLHMACSIGNYEAAKLLLRAGASPNEYGGDNSTTPLYEAVCKAHLNIVKLLVEFGTDIAAKDKAGKSIVEIETSTEVRDYIRCVLADNATGSATESGAYTPIVGEKRLPTIYVLNSVNSMDTRPFMLLSELCTSLNLSENCFKRIYQQSLDFVTMDNESIASRIINPFLRDSFERSSVSVSSCLVEVNSFLRDLLGNTSKNYDSGSQDIDAPEKAQSYDSEETVEMVFNSFRSEHEIEMRSDDMKRLKFSIQNNESHGNSHSDIPSQNHLDSSTSKTIFRHNPLSGQVLLPGFISASCHSSTGHHIDALPNVDLDLDADEEIRVPPKVLKSSKQKSHPLLSSSSSRIPDVVGAPKSLVSLVPATPPCDLLLPNSSLTPENDSAMVRPSDDISASLAPHVIEAADLSSKQDAIPFVFTRGHSSSACCVQEAALAPESIPGYPDDQCVRQSASSISSDGFSTAANRESTKANRKTKFAFDLKRRHPGDIYAVTGVKAGSAFSMLDVRNIE
ncbi:hypothetical protein BOX15_Mlig012267g2 [Macrostomum lignano]|uniref:Uncharacterized protein n=1 Tax=Macrostomum lignano TaxID=282301 RepID=A0A267E974_9PLAT|nr:hypothetical protein BOX15_Mlig012267g2 [Macrostomum lignano]